MRAADEHSIRLNTGASMPVVGLGTYRSGRGHEARQAVGWALESGYRLFDTSLAYWNESDVGWAVEESGLERAEVFITTKLENDDHGYNSTLRACHKSLANLGSDYIDLYLIHWPVPNLRDQTWRAMERLQAEGKCLAIGVSNYTIRHLQELLGYADIIPAVNQVEFHPFLFQQELLSFCRERGIVLEAYSPLVKATRMDHPLLKEIAANHGKTPAQVLVRWHVELGVPCIPKSVHRDYIRENLDVWDFALEEGEMARLNALNEGRRGRLDWDPSDIP